jgi:GAF domain-containing protein
VPGCVPPSAGLRIDSTAEERRWPEFAALAAAHGIAATLSVPVAARGESLGALNFYSRTGPFDDLCTEQAEVFARQSAIVLANAQVYWDARQLGENLQQAMRSRAVIDQAIGILLADGGRTRTRHSSSWSARPSGSTASSATSPPRWSTVLSSGRRAMARRPGGHPGADRLAGPLPAA